MWTRPKMSSGPQVVFTSRPAIGRVEFCWEGNLEAAGAKGAGGMKGGEGKGRSQDSGVYGIFE